ncbi:Tetraspanin family protein [Tritrichomonas foetus]|uniref:Tetraspanin family protein n=1 Tax=Tritrichomonas foetus TaxID=1144522 RepID=A0A1J4JX24_9EUKA|nr:Tetraspanin family protein [Tritrichomonas foetus]|eukprot:OHT03547.1 Tetraspanin family protein [Tritrichomonas foetus]
MCCKCKKIYPHEEKKLMVKMFVGLTIIQAFVCIALCSVSVIFIQSTNLTWFLPIDILTLMIAVIILSMILFIVGISSAVSNTTFAWVWFHFFMIILLFIEMVISWFTSDIGNLITLSQKTWIHSFDEERSEIQSDLLCCGFANSSDYPAKPCMEDHLIGCQVKLLSLSTTIRDVASIALFVDFIFALFYDFMGCAICFHPEVITFDQIDDDITSDSYEKPLFSPTILVDPLDDKGTLTYT